MIFFRALENVTVSAPLENPKMILPISKQWKFKNSLSMLPEIPTTLRIKIERLISSNLLIIEGDPSAPIAIPAIPNVDSYVVYIAYSVLSQPSYSERIELT